ncbi:MAG: hypothetical protein WD226_03490 [Planctomycetota bacterium]
MTGAADDEATETEANRALARLFASLLLLELDGDALDELREPPVRAALRSIGVDVPDASTPEEIDQLAAEFHARLLRPESGVPLVQSLVTTGSYQGDPAETCRRLGEVAALEFDAGAASGAQPDHLGSILLLWAETRGYAPEVAERIEAEHLAWSLAPLAQLAKSGGFYGAVAAALARWLETLLAVRG